MAFRSCSTKGLFAIQESVLSIRDENSGSAEKTIEYFQDLSKREGHSLTMKTAIFNMLAVMHFDSHNTKGAVTNLEKVLEENMDPNNLNALGALRYIYSTIGLMLKAEECRKAIDKVLLDEDMASASQAKCWAEQGWVLLERDSDVIELKKAREALEKALLLGKDADLSRIDILRWKTLLCKAQIKIHEKEEFQNYDHIENTIELLWNILQDSHIDEDVDLKGMCWNYLARIVKNDTIKGLLQRRNEEMPRVPDNAEYCYEQAIQCSPNSVEIKCGYSRYLLDIAPKQWRVDKSETAILLLNSIDNENATWNELQHKSHSLSRKYKMEMHDNTSIRIPNKGLLLDARECVDLLPNFIAKKAQNIALKANVLGCLALHDRRYCNGDVDRDLLDEALICYNDSLDNNPNPGASMFHIGELLCEGEYYKDGIERYKKAMDENIMSGVQHHNGYILFCINKALLALHKRDNDDSVLSDIADNIAQEFDNFNNYVCRNVRVYCRINKEAMESVAVMLKMERNRPDIAHTITMAANRPSH